MRLIEQRLADRGLVLPQPLKLPKGMVLPFPEVNIRGNRAFVSGASATEPDGTISGPFGKVGKDVSIETAVELACKTGLVILGSLKRTIGDLDRIDGWARVFGMVNSASGFGEQPRVINGFTHLFLEIFGDAVGRHARSAVGMASLPMQIAVEIEAEVVLKP